MIDPDVIEKINKVKLIHGGKGSVELTTEKREVTEKTENLDFHVVSWHYLVIGICSPRNRLLYGIGPDMKRRINRGSIDLSISRFSYE